MTRSWRALPAAAAVALPLLGAPAAAAQWIVDDDGPADFPSVQAAVNAFYVHQGDTVLVRPGTYAGTVYLSGKDLRIVSEGGPFRTTLDAQGMGSVVALVNRSAATRLEGFTLTGGTDAVGGGIWVDGGAPVITRNIIEGNSAVGGVMGYGYGGGIEIYRAAPTVTRNVIRGNTALDGGGGIDVYYSGPASGTCCPVITHNTFVGNSVSAPGGRGGGLLSFASEPSVAANIVDANAAAAGGGVYAYRLAGNSDLPQVQGNLFFANTPDDGDGSGGWSLSASNVHADPRLGDGDGIDLWPSFDSPALEAGIAAAPAWPDLAGGAAPVDSDLDGAALAEVGALENQAEVTSLRLAPGALPGEAALSWDPSGNPAVGYNVYVEDGDPFRTSGGSCLAQLLASPVFSDPAPLLPRQVRFYLVTGEAAVEGSRGTRSDETARPSTPSCATP
jgi:hypothetical protein